MTTSNSVSEHTALRFGIFTALGLIALFILMKVLGLLHIVELRSLNLFILIGGIVLSLKSFRKALPASFTYFKGLGLGALTSIFACCFFGLFVFVYVSFLDTAFMETIRNEEPMGRFLNPYIISVVIAVEGIASGLLVTFVTMNYLPTVDN
jgi:hypothetical protein